MITHVIITQRTANAEPAVKARIMHVTTRTVVILFLTFAVKGLGSFSIMAKIEFIIKNIAVVNINTKLKNKI